MDAVLSKIRDSEKINREQLKKVTSPLKLKQYKVMPKTQDDLLIHYCQWIHVENMERRFIDGEEHNLNAGNSTDFSDKSISDNVADELIATAINAGSSEDFADYAAGGLIAAINAGNSTDCTNLLI